jgi:hypothetical protein
VLVICEVKTGRRVGRYRPGDRVDAPTLARLCRAARGLARAAGCPRWRVDLVEVVVPAAGGLRPRRPPGSPPRRPGTRPAIRWVRGLAASAGPEAPGTGSDVDRDPRHSFAPPDRR